MPQMLALDSLRSMEANAQSHGNMGLAGPGLPGVLGCAVIRLVVGVGIPEVRIFLE